jgi:hypothetical protein
MIEFPFPELTQYADQRELVTISDVIDPGFLMKNPDNQQFVMRVAGDPSTDDLGTRLVEAEDRFSELLGVLRAQKHGRGERQAEVGRAPGRDELGNQFVPIGTAREYARFPGAIEGFAAKASSGMKGSSAFREALRVFGRPNRDAADYYLVYELAEKEFGGWQGIRDRLGFSRAKLEEFTKSANHLAATSGGRHASGDPAKATMNLDDMSRFIRELMAAWVNVY